MRRRDFVKGILAASAAAKAMAAQQAAPAAPAASAAQHTLPPATPIAPGPVPWMRGLIDVKPLDMGTVVPDTVAQTEAHFFNAQQTATLRRLCALLMPPLKGRPGALDAGTPEFLDFLIGVSPRDQKQMYLSGLDRLDAEAKHKFGAGFGATTDVQADALIRPWLRAWMTDHPPAEPFARFINLVHSDIRMATINSQAWSEAGQAERRGAAGVDLYWYPVDPDMHRDAKSSVAASTVRQGRG
jgi:hypothetical protein